MFTLILSPFPSSSFLLGILFYILFDSTRLTSSVNSAKLTNNPTSLLNAFMTALGHNIFYLNLRFN